METERILEAAQKLTEACNQLGMRLCELADAIADVFQKLWDIPELYPDSNGTPTKKYGMALRKCPLRTSVHYHYIPRAPRNMPYMRRTY